MRIRLVILALFCSSQLFAGALLRVRIYTTTEISAVSFTVSGNSYNVWCSDSTQFTVKAGTNFSVSFIHDSLQLKRNDTLIGKYTLVKVTEQVVGGEMKGFFKIKLNIPDKPARVYDDGLEFAPVAGFLRVLNLVDIEHYTQGVIQAEVGKMNPLEFNKVKAIIIRTYSLSNLRKHEPENYHLCDQTHCQVYRGKSYVENIINATTQTQGLVLVDTSVALVNAAFFSNCGGQTCNSEDVWIRSLPYLRSVKDTFCCRSLDAVWEKKIPKKDWLNYFEKKYKLNTSDSTVTNQLLSFSQDSGKIYFMQQPAVPLKVLRDDWKLKSTFFSVEQSGEFVLLKGRGFGHGVGLCQEGAMRMAKLGYTSQQIIDFYYQDVTLIDLQKLEFFKEE
ncbi:MAG TPA: SpoIID/LytB domain-containing protein [Bacteroidia bacterium]